MDFSFAIKINNAILLSHMRQPRYIVYKRMSAVKSKNSKLELAIRKRLFSLGYRFRLHCKDIYGKPDIVFKKLKIAIFCDSHFWHGYEYKETLKRINHNKKFWEEKFKRNIKRDKEVTQKLEKEGWVVIRFWEHEIDKSIDECINKIKRVINNDEQ